MAGGTCIPHHKEEWNLTYHMKTQPVCIFLKLHFMTSLLSTGKNQWAVKKFYLVSTFGGRQQDDK